jgi:hypothetical protein
MTRFLALALALAVSITCTAAAALTLEPVAGSTPQTTRLYSFLPHRVGIIARDDSGAPMPNVEVTFSAPFDTLFIIPNYSNEYTVTTGADGIAWAARPGYIAYGIGTSVITVTSPGASNDARIQLRGAGTAATRLELLSGDPQTAQVGGEYAPWIARALDDDGNPVPYTAVLYAVNDLGEAAATFEDGSTNMYAAADAHGVATSGKLAANGIEGSEFGVAQLTTDFIYQTSPTVFFNFTNVAEPAAGSLRVYQAPPRSIAVGLASAIGFAMKVFDASGQPVAGAPVIFSTDSSCGTFAGAAVFSTMTSADGVSTSPPFTGKRTRTSCATWAMGGGQTFDLAMHVYDPKRVVATLSPHYVVTHLDTYYRIEVAFAESGRPVHVPYFDIRALFHFGPSFAKSPLVDIWSDRAWLDFMPNEIPGPYLLEFRQGGNKTVIPVLQIP